MQRQSSSIIFGLMALLTLVMIMVLPILGQSLTGVPSSANSESASVPWQMRALDNQRSQLVRVEGGLMLRGTTSSEIEQTMQRCTNLGATCDPALAADSMPAHRLQIDSFWMEITEVTFQQYVAFLNSLGPGGHINGCDGHLCAITRDESNTSSIALQGGIYVTTNPALNNYPVVDVTWHGAQAYCESLGRRLPTEAEWEHAARGADSTLYPWGNEWSQNLANVRGAVQNESGVIIAGPQPVGAQPANASRRGIRDLAGNVGEWVADWYDRNHYASSLATSANDRGPEAGTERVIRGGSWNDNFFFARSVQRKSMDPALTSASVGFRCVADD